MMSRRVHFSRGLINPSGDARGDTGEGAGPAATHQLHQHAFGHVVPVVAGGHRGGLSLLLELEENLITMAAPRSFAP